MTGTRIVGVLITLAGAIALAVGVFMATYHDKDAASAAISSDAVDRFGCALGNPTACRGFGSDYDEDSDRVAAAEEKRQTNGIIVAGIGALVAVGGVIVIAVGRKPELPVVPESKSVDRE